MSSAAPVLAGDIAFAAGGADVNINVQALNERRFGSVIQQQYDFSCGSAAVATLLTYHYGRKTTEEDAFRSMWNVGDQDRIRELGFSMFEMKSYLETLGMIADGFQLTLDRIAEIGVPGIALIDTKGYKHFVVIKGITDKTVLVGDPAKGVLTIKRKKFEKSWDGTILFVRSDVATGKANFNKVADWKYAPSGPFHQARQRDADSPQQFTLSQTRPSFSGFSIPTITSGNP